MREAIKISMLKLLVDFVTVVLFILLAIIVDAMKSEIVTIPDIHVIWKFFDVITNIEKIIIPTNVIGMFLLISTVSSLYLVKKAKTPRSSVMFTKALPSTVEIAKSVWLVIDE